MVGGWGRPGLKKAPRRSLGVHSAHKYYSAAPNNACLEAGAGLGPKKLLDAAWAYTRPTNMNSRPQTKRVKKAPRGGLGVHSAHKYSLYGPKQSLFGGRGLPGPKTAARRSLGAHSAPNSGSTAPNKACLEAGRPGAKIPRLLAHLSIRWPNRPGQARI